MKGIDFNDRHTIYLPNITIADSKVVNGMVTVTETSRDGLKQSVERFGQYIAREQHYDFPMGIPEREQWKACLFLTNYFSGLGKRQPCGAAFFEFVTKDQCDEAGYSDRWWLMWVWLHPYERSKGLLQEAWKHFKAAFGDFHIQRPLSKSMERFLQKQETQ
jgi:hypothetical protein